MSESHIDPHMMRLPGEQIAAEHYLRTRIAELSQRVTQANETIVLQARTIVTRSEAIKRVRDLHAQMSCDCVDCTIVGDLHDPVCKACGDDYAYPCPTIRALDGEQHGEQSRHHEPPISDCPNCLRELAGFPKWNGEQQ